MAISGGYEITAVSGDIVGVKLSVNGQSVVLYGNKGQGEVDYTLNTAEAMKLLQYLSIIEQAAKNN